MAFMDDLTESETFFLTRKVMDLDDFVSNPPKYLVSIKEQPAEAARVCQRARSEDRYWSEGFISLSYAGKVIIDRRYWDDVYPLWAYLVTLVDDYWREGYAESFFPDQPVEIILKNENGVSIFKVGDDDALEVDPVRLSV
jgi:hypothetical protein